MCAHRSKTFPSLLIYTTLFLSTALSQSTRESADVDGDSSEIEVGVFSFNALNNKSVEPVKKDAENGEDNGHGNEEYDESGERQSEFGLDFGEFVPRNVNLGFIYIIYIVGVLSNAALFLLMQLRFATFSYSVYIRFLAVVDSVVLITVCTEDILQTQVEKIDEFHTITEWFCKVWLFVTSVSRQLSPWLVVAFTFERFVAVVFPFRRKLFGTVKRALIISLIIVGTFCLEGVATLVIFRIVYLEDGHKVCNFLGYEHYTTYYNIRRLFIETCIPCVLILVLNINVIIGLSRGKAFRRAAAASLDGTVSKQRSCDSGATISLVAVSLMVFVTLTPAQIVEMVEFVWSEKLERDETMEVPTVIKNVLRSWPVWNLLRLLNYGQNIYIFMLTSRSYRSEFVSMVRCEKQKQGREAKK